MSYVMRPLIVFDGEKWQVVAMVGNYRTVPPDAFLRAHAYVRVMNERRAMAYFTK